MTAFESWARPNLGYAVYMALCNIASRRGSPTFQASRAEIGVYAGCSISTVQRATTILREAGIIRVEPQTLKTPCVYSILSMAPPDTTIAPDNGQTSIDAYKEPIQETEESKAAEPSEVEKETLPATPRKSFSEMFRASLEELAKAKTDNPGPDQ